MRNTALALITVLAVMLLAAVPSDAAVRNINLSPTGAQGVGGTATIITGTTGGISPHQNVEVNVRMNQSPPAGGLYQAWLLDSRTGQAMSLGVFSGANFTARTSLAQAQGIQMFDNVAVSYLAPGTTARPTSPNIVAQGMLPGNVVTAADFGTMAVLPEDEMFQRQLMMERFQLTSVEITDLRMRGFDYGQIGAIANAAYRCGRPVTDVASALEQGQSWNQIAQACNLTVAQLLTPLPAVAVAGARQELRPGFVPAAPGIAVPTHYLTRPNGARVLTYSQWQRFSSSGYEWREVATAANISQRTGVPVGDILMMTRIQGLTFRQIAMNYNIPWTDVDDVSAWPWERNGELTMIPSAPGTAAGTTGPTYNPNVPNY